MTSTPVETPFLIDSPVRSGASRRRVLSVVGPLAVVVAVAAFVFARSSSEAPRYGTAVVERRTIVRTVDVSGYIDVLRRVEVPALVDGQILSVLVRPGDRVTQGQVLATLDGRARSIATRAAAAGLDASANKVKDAAELLAAASDARERTERLNARELASERDLVAARSAETRARAALAIARAERVQVRENLHAARLSEELSGVTAPITGVVLQAPDASGATVGPERGPLFVLGTALDTLRIDAEVAESEVGDLKPGQPAEFSVPAFSGRSFQARVERVGVDAHRSPVAVRYPVELRADNPRGELLPGMTTTVQIAVARVVDALATRDAALRFTPEGVGPASTRSRVWQVTPGGLVPVAVSPGLSDGAFTELRPEQPGALQVGAELALGVLGNEAPKVGGPGIRLGNH